MAEPPRACVVFLAALVDGLTTAVGLATAAGRPVLERVRQDLEDDPELAGLAAVLAWVVDHAAQGHGPVLGALTNAVQEVEEAVFSPARAWPTEAPTASTSGSASASPRRPP
jgi:hypothetical protein